MNINKDCMRESLKDKVGLLKHITKKLITFKIQNAIMHYVFT